MPSLGSSVWKRARAAVESVARSTRVTCQVKKKGAPGTLGASKASHAMLCCPMIYYRAMLGPMRHAMLS